MKRCSLALNTLYIDEPLVFSNDVHADGKTKTCSHPYFFRSKERVEYSGQSIFRNSDSIVLKCNFDRIRTIGENRFFIFVEISIFPGLSLIPSGNNPFSFSLQSHDLR